MAKEKVVEQLLDDARQERERKAEELREQRERDLQERRRAQHDELKGEYLQAFESLGGTQEEFEDLWPNLGQSVIGQKAIDQVERKQVRARRQMRSIWGARASAEGEKGYG